MQMINEITVMQQYKNIFNKILSELKRHKDSFEKSSCREIQGRVYFNLTDNIRVEFSIRHNIELKDIILVKENSNIYFCATILGKVGVKDIVSITTPEDIIYSGYVNLTKLSKALQVIEMLLYGKEGNNEAARLLREDSINKNSNESYIKSTNLYKKIKKLIDGIGDVNCNFVLNSVVYKKLKIRENIVPLIVFNMKDGGIVYAGEKSTWSSNALAKEFKWHTNINTLLHNGRSGDDTDGFLNPSLSMMCKAAIVNTPYNLWCIPEYINNGLYKFYWL